MDIWLLGVVLIVIGVLMLIVEATTPGFFIAIPASVLIVIGTIGVWIPDLFWSPLTPIIAVVLTVPMSIITIHLYKKLAPPEPPTTTVGTSLIGKRGVVMARIIPRTLKGKVKLESQIWSATSEKEIEEGRDVEVVESKGVHVIVKEVKL